ncbi:MAG: winged helix-turn-helix transcriptional regulator [Anaerolineae bacterium]|nr:winged helix-turn-helix transcriptional regulator [Anaerolineae bacterium]
MSIPLNAVTTDELELLHARFCQALGDPKRLHLLYTLAEAPATVNELAQRLATPQPTISRHLAILRQSGILSAERNGTTIRYSIAEPRIIDVLDLMRQMLRDLIKRQGEALE